MKMFITEEYGYRRYFVTTSASYDEVIAWWKTVVPFDLELERIVGCADEEVFVFGLPDCEVRVPEYNEALLAELNDPKLVFGHIHQADDSDLDGHPPVAWIQADESGVIPDGGKRLDVFKVV